MSNKNQETIADNVDAMRNEGHTGEASCLEWIRAKMTYYADRIEAAAKREREAGAEAAQICGEIGDMVGREEAKNQSVTNCNRFGNAAKMRDACSNISEYAKAAECHTEDTHLLGYLKQIERWAEAALAEPPRNCDRPECATTDAAQEVWRKEDGGKTAYYDWLLATSTKGETDGSK